MVKIQNIEVREYFLSLHNLLQDTDNNFAVAKLLGGEAGNLADRWKAIEQDTYVIYGKVTLFSDPAVVDSINACLTIYSKIKDSRDKGFSSISIRGYASDVAVNIENGFPTVDPEAVPDIDLTERAIISQSWFSVLGRLDKVLLLWSEYKKTMTQTSPKLTELNKIGDKMQIAEAHKIRVGKLAAEGAERLYKLCAEYKVFNYVGRNIFSSGFSGKGGEVLTINTKAAFGTLYRNSHHIFTSEGSRNQFFCSFDSAVLMLIEKQGAAKFKNCDKQKKFAKELNGLI